MYKKYRKGVSCVIYNLSKNKILYLLLHRKKHWTGWEFTKGGKKPKEKLKKTVKREVMEETHLRIMNIKNLPIHGKFIYDKKSQKDWKAKGFTYTVFACQLKKGKPKLDRKEHDRYKWTTYKQALKLLRWPNQKKSLKIVNKYLKTKGNI